MTTPAPPRRRWLSYSLKTLFFQIVPCSAVCVLVLTAGVDEGIPMFHWVKLVIVGIISGLWIVLFQEDKRARQRQAAERPTQI